ncbi:hypothetical protein [Staphylothermus hellenicus]|nr:hypothetical protein [Staphylothermus hellenicus]
MAYPGQVLAMLYRIKIARCIDALVKIDSENELGRILEEIRKLCPIDSKMYLHIVREENL